MKQIKIADITLAGVKNGLSFKQKLEIARKLERLGVDAVELPELSGDKADTLLVRTISSFVKNSVLSVGATTSAAAVERAAEALSSAAHPRIRVELPMSSAVMEYSLHKKQDKMLVYIRTLVEKAKSLCADVEFVAADATRAEEDFLKDAVRAAVDAGADCVKTCVGGDVTPLRAFAAMLSSIRENYGVSAAIRSTELHRSVDQIEWIISGKAQTAVREIADDGVKLNVNDTVDTVREHVEKLGYDLSDEDIDKVYEEFRRLARKKSVGVKELDAIVASSALQVPSTYAIESYVINSGNIITASAQITLKKGDKPATGVAVGDGPIDAAFKALEQIIGRHFELDDFSIKTVTQEKEAMGSALVRLRAGGRIYSGTGLSTDIIGASVRAYVNAVNKIVYEEE